MSNTDLPSKRSFETSPTAPVSSVIEEIEQEALNQELESTQEARLAAYNEFMYTSSCENNPDNPKNTCKFTGKGLGQTTSRKEEKKRNTNEQYIHNMGLMQNIGPGLHEPIDAPTGALENRVTSDENSTFKSPGKAGTTRARPTNKKAGPIFEVFLDEIIPSGNQTNKQSRSAKKSSQVSTEGSESLSPAEKQAEEDLKQAELDALLTEALTAIDNASEEELLSSKYHSTNAALDYIEQIDFEKMSLDDALKTAQILQACAMLDNRQASRIDILFGQMTDQQLDHITSHLQKNIDNKGSKICDVCQIICCFGSAALCAFSLSKLIGMNKVSSTKRDAMMRSSKRIMDARGIPDSGGRGFEAGNNLLRRYKDAEKKRIEFREKSNNDLFQTVRREDEQERQSIIKRQQACEALERERHETEKIINNV